MRNLSETPLVTVVIPTYRRANKLPRAIDSVLGQTYRNIEVLIANDNVPGSPEDEATKRRLACYVADGRLREVETGGKTGGEQHATSLAGRLAASGSPFWTTTTSSCPTRSRPRSFSLWKTTWI